MEPASCDLPALIREECQDLLEQIGEKTARIAARDKKLKELAAQSDMSRRNRAQLFTLFALGNLFLVRRKLLACGGVYPPAPILAIRAGRYALTAGVTG